MIDGVIIKSLQVNADQRGSFSEVFRREWLPDGFEVRQINRSESKAGVLRGLHYHQQQADYWFLARGRVQVGLFDMRPNSSTYEETQVVEMVTRPGKFSSIPILSEDKLLLQDIKPVDIYIPPGIAHGYLALYDSVLIYVVDQYYDPEDDKSLWWDSAGIDIDWDNKSPILSERDAGAPTWTQLKEYNDHWNSPLPIDDPLKLYNL